MREKQGYPNAIAIRMDDETRDFLERVGRHMGHESMAQTIRWLARDKAAELKLLK